MSKQVGTGREREKKKIIIPTVPTRLRVENSEKNIKKFKKLKGTIQASFQTKTGQDSSWMREKKNYRSNPSYPNQNRKFRKKEQKKIQKIKNHHSGFILMPKRVGTSREWEKKKIIAPILPTRPRIENSKKK